MALTLDIGRCCLQGNYRSNNEDAVTVHVLPDYTLCLVADGMGGQEAGEWASRTAVEVIPRELRCRLPPDFSTDQARQIFTEAIQQAHEAILTRQRQGPPGRRMGSTIVGALHRGGRKVIVTHMGDSPAFLFRNGRVTGLTRPHDTRRALLDAGTITAEQARQSPIRNVLYKYLGCAEMTPCQPDDQVQELQPDDSLLLCSDGVTGVLEPEKDIPPLLREVADTQDCADQLAQLALDRGSRDNVSCVLIRVAQGEPDPVPLRTSALPSGWSENVRLLTRALVGGEDCAFALHDALLEEGHPDLARHLREPGHAQDCWAVKRILEG
jgi:protein phosphatase